MRAKKFKNINIIRARSGDWRVRYEFEDPRQPGVFKKFYVRDGINYVHDLKEKEKAICELSDDIVYALKHGYNPFYADTKIETEIFVEETEMMVVEEAGKIKLWGVGEAVKKFFEYCGKVGLTQSTVRTYRSFTNNFEKWFRTIGRLDVAFSDLTDEDVQEFLDHYFYEEEWTPRTYNNHAKFMSQFFGRVAI